MPQHSKTQPVIIKKYANRRLYNTAISSYVTLDDLCELVKIGEDFVVLDAKNDEDLTRSVLAQIIFEQESKGSHMLSEEFLRSVITFYDDGLKSVVPLYLNSMMQAFQQNQEEMRKQLNSAGADFNPFTQFNNIYQSAWQKQQDVQKQMLSKTMDIFTSFNPILNKDNKDKQ
jgi:polyhydroxyalkanoate synthesis repressor PhaR